MSFFPLYTDDLAYLHVGYCKLRRRATGKYGKIEGSCKDYNR